MAIAPLATLPTAPPAGPKPFKKTLDQSDFLALMSAQLKNQDPTKPVENTEYVAQMAQFSTVSGIAATNNGIAETNNAIARSNTALAGIATRLDALIAAATSQPKE